jgi:hypothetical protein
MNRYLSQQRGRNMSHLSEDQLDELVAEERSRDYAPLNDWRTIAARARDEGLILHNEPRGWSPGQPWMQAAAAVLLLVGGIAIGRTTLGLPGAAATGEPSAQVASNVSAPVPDVSATPISVASSKFASVDEATTTLVRAATEYQRAAAYIAANNSAGVTTSDSVRFYAARLAALKQLGNAMETALQTAPHDPIINQYYLATMGAKVATQQLVSRPVGLGLKAF